MWLVKASKRSKKDQRKLMMQPNTIIKRKVKQKVMLNVKDKAEKTMKAYLVLHCDHHDYEFVTTYFNTNFIGFNLI
jgi:hypothetical protein